VWSASLAAPVSLTPVAPGGITLITDPSSILSPTRRDGFG